MRKLTSLGLFVATVVLIVGLTAGLSVVLQPGPPAVDTTAPPTYDTTAAMIEPLPATGTVTLDVDAEGTVVVFDEAHANRYDHDAIHAMTAALTIAGADVRFHDGETDLEDVLADADAYVVIDPARQHSAADVETVVAFVDEGGRLVMIGEPTRTTVANQIVATHHSALGSLAGRFGMSFGTEYLYATTERDGTFRNIVVTATDAGTAGVSSFEQVDRGVMYTATHVAAADGDAYVVAGDGVVRSQGDREPREYAVVHVDGSVMGVGDATFVRGERAVVADNEHLIAGILEFMVADDAS